MNTLRYSSYNMSRVLSIPHPRHILQLNLTYHYFRTNTSDFHPPREVTPPVWQCQTFSIDQSCLTSQFASYFFVKDVSCTIGLNFSVSDVETLMGCIMGYDPEMSSDGGIAVVASVDVKYTEVIIGDDVTSVFSEDTMILNAIRSRPDTFGSASTDRVIVAKDLLKAVTFDRSTNGGGIACPICLDNFEDGCRVASAPCSHLFHGKCINKWIKKRSREPNCPLCRSPILVVA